MCLVLHFGMNLKHGVCHLKGCHTHFTSEDHMSFVHSRYLILFVSKYTFYLPLYFKIYTNIKAYFNQIKWKVAAHHGFFRKKKTKENFEHKAPFYSICGTVCEITIPPFLHYSPYNNHILKTDFYFVYTYQSFGQCN